MIQRIQTIYLIIAILFNVLFFFTPFFETIQTDPGDWLLPVIAASAGFASLISFAVIFMYKNRPVQLKWCSYAMLFQVIAVGASAGVILSIWGVSRGEPWEMAGIGMLLLAWIFQFLAMRGIKKDEKLIKSMDRIR